MPWMCGKRMKYLRNGFTMLKMTKEFDKRINVWEMTYVCGKLIKYLRNGYNMCEMTQICGKWLKYTGYGLSI